MLIGWLPSLAHDFEVDGIFYDKINSSTVEVTYKGYSYDSYSNEYSGDIVIPSSVNYNGTTYSVTSIRNYAFLECTSLTSIEIPNSVTWIGFRAFSGCSSLTSIKIPNSVTYIENDAFSGCDSLTSVVIGNSVTSIGDSAFSDCDSLTSIVVDAGNSKYDSRNGCNAIIETASNTLIAGCQNTIIPNNVTSIGDYAFDECTSLTSIEIPNSVTSIGGRAFYHCSSLTSIEIPNSVTSIGNHAFLECTSLTSIEIPNSVTSIGNYAFYGCSSLTSIEIPNSVTYIGNYAFYGCSKLTSIEIPNGVTKIAYSAFSGCSSLTSIKIPNSVTYIENDAFSGCSSLISIEIPNSVTSIGDSAFKGCTDLTDIEIPNSVTSIENSAFYGCSKLTSIEIPNSVTNIEYAAFSYCKSLTSIIVDESNTKYDSRENCNAIIETATNTLVVGCKNSKLPNNVTSIGISAFNGCTDLTDIEIPHSITSIGEYAFYGCSSLTNIVIPNDITRIENETFRYCTSLTSIIIPNNITIVGVGAFRDCTSLIDVTIGKSVNYINCNAFYGCSSLTKITCLAIEPPGLNLPFQNFSADLYVPFGCTNNYRNSFWEWSMFTKILELPALSTSITLDMTKVSLRATETTTLVATVLPEATANKGVEWSSSDENIAIVDNNGVVTAVAVGEAIITATTVDGSNLNASCKVTVVPTLAESIVLDKDEVTIIVPNSTSLFATILPELTTDKSVIWSSSDESIAIVNEEGVITAVSSGQVVITATTIDGSNLSATCNVNIIQLAESITLDKEDVKLEATETTSLTATILPETTSDKNVTWSSSNESVATIDANGLVTAIAVGEAIITAATTDGSNLSATCKVTVVPTLATSITLDKTEYEIAEKSDFQLVATVLPELATDKGVVWSSSDKWVVSVNENGLVTAYSVGEATITATTTDGSDLSASCKVTVVPTLAESITLDKIEISLEATETATLIVTVLPELTTDKSVEWSSSNESVATIDANGLVTAIAVGEAIITATTTDGSNLSASCKVTVVPTLAETITLYKTEISLEATETATLVATVLPELATDKSVEWSSSDESVAIVDANGVVTAISVGEAIITAATTDGSNLTASCKVIVIPTFAVSIELDQTEASVEEKSDLQLTATILPEHTTNKEVAWSSSDKWVASVDNYGLVTMYSAGEVIITATTTDGSNLSATCRINVYSGIDGVNGDDVIVATVGDNIVVKNTKLGSVVNVFASNGALIASEVATDGDVVIEAPVKGVYVVKVGKQTVKVII